MIKRSPLAVLVLSFITCGLYGIYWLVATKREMVARGAEIPTSWLLLIPLVNIYWQWTYATGVEHVTRGRMSGPVAFLLLFLLGPIGSAIVQASFNDVPDAAMALPRARIA